MKTHFNNLRIFEKWIDIESNWIKSGSCSFKWDQYRSLTLKASWPQTASCSKWSVCIIMLQKTLQLCMCAECKVDVYIKRKPPSVSLTVILLTELAAFFSLPNQCFLGCFVKVHTRTGINECTDMRDVKVEWIHLNSQAEDLFVLQHKNCSVFPSEGQSRCRQNNHN